MSEEHRKGEGEELPAFAELLAAGGEAIRQTAVRVGGWISEHREGIAEVAAGLMTIALLQPRLAELERRWGNSEWAYLIERLDFVNAMALVILLDESIDGEIDGAVLDFMEEALRDPTFIAACREGLGAVPLSTPQRRQLGAGLAHVREGDYELAVPLMIVALEGAFTAEAERRELVRRVKTKIAYTEASGKHGNVGSAEEVFKLLGLEEDLLAFLRRQVYGSRGNAFRHGVAVDGFRLKALTLTVALVAYLDLMNEKDGTLLVEAFGRQGGAQGIVAKLLESQLPPAVPPLAPVSA